MLIEAFTVNENYKADETIFLAELPLWDDSFGNNFGANIEQFLKEHFGIATKAWV